MLRFLVLFLLLQLVHFLVLFGFLPRLLLTGWILPPILLLEEIQALRSGATVDGWLPRALSPWQE